MGNGNKLLLFVIIIFTVLFSNFLVLAKPNEMKLTVIEIRANAKPRPTPPPPTDDSLDNDDYALLGYRWTTTTDYWVNTANPYGYSETDVVDVFTASAETWDAETTFDVFSYQGTTTLVAGTYDEHNVVSFGKYRKGVIGVTYLWSISGIIVETDTRLNTLYPWSISEDGVSGKMDVENIMTHEFGHWCGLADLYSSSDYWLTMYGYSDYGITYGRTLGMGDINGLIKVYGS